jgi:hypothetical protein
MKRILFVLIFLALSAFTSVPVKAQGNSFVGTWKLNLAKSKFELGPAPKSMTRTVETRGKSANYSFEGIAADGSPVAYSFNTDYDGKDSPVTGTGTPGGADSIAIKRVGKNKFHPAPLCQSCEQEKRVREQRAVEHCSKPDLCVTPFTTSRLISEWQRSGALVKRRGKVLLRSPERLFLRTL